MDTYIIRGDGFIVTIEVDANNTTSLGLITQAVADAMLAKGDSLTLVRT